MSQFAEALSWTGCHGVRVDGDAVGFGRVNGTPLATVTVRRGEVAPPDGTQLWSQHGQAVVSDEHIEVARELHRRSDGRLVVSGSHKPFVDVDVRNRLIVVGEGTDSSQRQMLASFALPLVLHGTGALLLHASACADRAGATVICGDTGVGKSTALVRLANAHWQAVTEDICSIDLRGDTPHVWPGPPWVRLARGTGGPGGSEVLFESGDKTAWDIAPRQPAGPVPIARIVVLDPPTGEVLRADEISATDAIRSLARHAVWLGEPDERGPSLFGRVARLTAKVPAYRVRLPRGDVWTNAMSDLFAAGELIS
ncbi:MAG TPA: hypothetical protein VMZ22_13735 [Acidimicrobiales bacterium]|nr:hypothetical protein [Acidimicrobiales bacterium]